MMSPPVLNRLSCEAFTVSVRRSLSVWGVNLTCSRLWFSDRLLMVQLDYLVGLRHVLH